MNQDLFAKLDAIEIPPTNLPDEDQEAINQLDATFKEHLRNFDNAKTSLENLETNSTWLDRKREELLEELKEERSSARTVHLANVVDHFNTVHNLRLNTPWQWREDDETLEDEQLTKYAVDWVLKQLGGKTFHEVATDALRARFKQAVWGVKRNRQHVTLVDYIYVSEGYDGEKFVGYNGSDKLSLLAQVIARFEFGRIPRHLGLADRLKGISYHREDVFGEAIPLFNERCQELTIYKNGNVRLTFSSEEQAAAFITLFNLKLQD